MDSISQTTGLINLMDEFFIPEKDAKNYIQVIEDYTALRQNVADILRNEYNKLVEPEIREISNLCFITEQYINLSFDSLAIFRANQLYNTTDEPWVVRRNRIYPYSELLRSDSSEDVEMPLRWDFDYLRFIASFYDFLSASDETNKHNPEAAFGKSLNCVLLGGYTYFSSNKKEFNFNGIYEKDDFIVKKMTEEELEFWDREYHPGGQSTISFDTSIDFLRWITSKNPSIPAGLQGFDLHRLTYEEEWFLYDDYNIFNKAKQEGRLDDPKIERKIAIAVIKQFHYETNEQGINRVIKRLEGLVEGSKMQITELEQTSGHENLVEKNKNNLERRCYEIRAVEKHGEWIY